MQESEYNSEEAVERLTREFLRHQHLLLAYVRTLVQDYHQAEDIVQETEVETILSWNVGREAAFHEVGLSTGPNALALVVTTTESSYGPTSLDLDATYYW